MRRIALAALALVLCPEARAQAPNPAPSSMSTVVPRSAQRSVQTRAQRAAARNVPLASGCPYTVTKVTIPPNDDGSGFFTGTGFAEAIQVMTPCGFNPAGPDIPLLMVNNGWGLSAASFFNGMSDIPDEANARGWLVVAFTQLDDKSFGVVPLPQQNVERALDWVLANYPVDEDRIYGVGWSGGGGSIVSYAVRHLDPEQPMLAALVTNAGSYDLIDTYNNEVPSVQTIMENPALLKGPPSGTTLWQYRLSHGEELFQSGPTVVPEQTKLVNLKHIPVYHTWSTDDSIVYLRDQNQAFDTFLQGIGAPLTTQSFTGLIDPHSWDLIDAKTALDFLQQHTVTRYPESFDILADKNRTYYWASVTLRAQKILTPVACSADAAANHVAIELTNVNTLDLRPPTSLLDPTTHFTVSLTTTDAATTDLVFHGVPAAPTYVLLGAEVYDQWSHDGGAQTLTVTAPGSGTSTISVRYDVQTGVLTAPASVSVPANVPLNLTGSVPAKPAFLLLGLTQGVIPLKLFDPADDRNLLVAFSGSSVLLPMTLDGAGQASLVIGTDASLAGLTLYGQFLTYPGGATIVDEVSNRVEVEFQ